MNTIEWPCGVCHGPLRESERGYNTCDTTDCLGNIDAWPFRYTAPTYRLTARGERWLRRWTKAKDLTMWLFLLACCAAFLGVVAWTLTAAWSAPHAQLPERIR